MTLQVREHITNTVAKTGDRSCSVLMSSGIDSHSVLFSCLDAGLKPVITSFTLDDRESRDFRAARHAAAYFDLEFRPVVLSTDLTKLKKRVLQMARLGVKGKTAFECLWPMFTAFSAIKEDVVFSGYGADAYFALSKRGTMHYKDDVSKYALEAFEKYKEPDSQLNVLKAFAAKRGITYAPPWLNKHITRQVRERVFTWDELNRPKQKNPVREQYAEYLAGCMVYNHVNYQLGDSGISELFTKLLDDPVWNAAGYKSTTGIFNSVVRGEITQV
tara:strand:- start:112822 stop:113640 length:819 start_codon:yes stop_codon:yes gene_type:complete